MSIQWKNRLFLQEYFNKYKEIKIDHVSYRNIIISLIENKYSQNDIDHLYSYIMKRKKQNTNIKAFDNQNKIELESKSKLFSIGKNFVNPEKDTQLFINNQKDIIGDH